MLVDSDKRVLIEYYKFIANCDKIKFETFRHKTGMKLTHKHTIMKIHYLINCDQEIKSKILQRKDLV